MKVKLENDLQLYKYYIRDTKARQARTHISLEK